MIISPRNIGQMLGYSNHWTYIYEKEVDIMTVNEITLKALNDQLETVKQKCIELESTTNTNLETLAQNWLDNVLYKHAPKCAGLIHKATIDRSQIRMTVQVGSSGTNEINIYIKDRWNDDLEYDDKWMALSWTSTIFEMRDVDIYNYKNYLTVLGEVGSLFYKGSEFLESSWKYALMVESATADLSAQQKEYWDLEKAINDCKSKIELEVKESMMAIGATMQLPDPRHTFDFKYGYGRNKTRYVNGITIVDKHKDFMYTVDLIFMENIGTYNAPEYKPKIVRVNQIRAKYIRETVNNFMSRTRYYERYEKGK